MKKSLGNYQIEEEIGSGGMAVIYKAKQKSLDRLVAIKQLQSGFVTNQEVVQRFEREARAAADLQHENIVVIHDYWEKSGSYYIVMEYVDGIDLSQIIQKVRVLPVDIALFIALKVAKALEYAHGKGVVHRDIKPGNIMISREGKVKLMDFGIARVRSPEVEELTLPGATLGTPAYMSPEQVKGMAIDWRTDIFSFGIVLYEMFTGERPFKGDDKGSVTNKIEKGDFIPPRELNRKIPRPLQRLILRCLDKKPRKRYHDTSDVRRHLEKLAEKINKKAEYQEKLENYLIKCGIFKGVVVEKTAIKKAKPEAKPRINWPRMFRVAKIALIVLVPALLFSHFQNPGTLIHRVKKGENLSALAQQYYGDYQRNVYLVNRNRILNPARLRPGTDIVVPLVTLHRVGIGDSLPKLARSYLGDARKSGFIAQFNAIGERSPLKVGDRLRIPFELQHLVEPGQTLASISKHYYGNTAGYRLLMDYNSITDAQSLQVGDIVSIPVTNSRVTRKGLIQRVLDTFRGSPEEEKHPEDLEEAIDLYNHEDYSGSAAKLRSYLGAGEPGIEDLVQIRKYLAFSHARMGEKEASAEQFIALLELQPDFRLDEAEATAEITEVFDNLELEKF